MHSTLRAFYLHAKHINASCPSIPLTLIYPNLKTDAVLECNATSADVVLLPPAADTVSPKSKGDIAVNAFASSCGLLLEMAGEGVPQNDLTLYTKSVFVGEEYKYYNQGGYIELSVLQKRAYQMGYAYVNVAVLRGNRVTVCIKGAKYPAYELLDVGLLETTDKNIPIHSVSFSNGGTPTITLPSKASTVSALGKYHALRMGGNFKPTPQDYVVLCSPNNELLPPSVTSTFSSKAIPHTIGDHTMNYKTSESDSCEVVCKTFAVADFVTRCSGIENPSCVDGRMGRGSFERARYWVSDRGGSITPHDHNPMRYFVAVNAKGDFALCSGQCMASVFVVWPAH